MTVGCVTTENIGSKKIFTIPESTVASYANYLEGLKKYANKMPSGVFTYNPSARRGSFNIAWGGRNDADHTAMSTAMDICRKIASPPEDCKILDMNGKIVWKDLDPDIVARLTNSKRKHVDTTTHEFETGKIDVTAMQKSAYHRYLASIAKHPNLQNAFFIGDDGKTTKIATASSYYLAIDNARDSCSRDADGNLCYLFAVNGRPVNDAANAEVEKWGKSQ